MPELPEVEAYRRRIEDGALNRTIRRLTPGNDITHMDLPDASDRARLEGRQFGQARRHGKYLFAGLDGGPWLALHMGMAGSVRVYDQQDGQPDFTRLVVEFEGDRRLAFRDPRKFGWARVIDAPEDEIAARGLGPDALSLEGAGIAKAVADGRGAVKSALMDQARLAGIGNLWADEALYRSGIRPDAVARDLSEGRLSDLGEGQRAVLDEVCAVNARYGDLPEDWLIHRREAGVRCSRCDGTIAKAKVGGRTSFFCPDHQTGA